MAAREDLRRLYRSGALTFGRAQADRYYDSLLKAFDHLLEFPESAAERRDLHHSVRILPHTSHNIIYRIAGDEVVVVRILHGHQKVRRYL